jgi:hypothetical protein
MKLCNNPFSKAWNIVALDKNFRHRMSTNKGPSRSDNLRFFWDLAQKLGKNVEKTNIIVAWLIGYKFFEIWGQKVSKFFNFYFVQKNWLQAGFEPVIFWISGWCFANAPQMQACKVSFFETKYSCFFLNYAFIWLFLESISSHNRKKVPRPL